MDKIFAISPLDGRYFTKISDLSLIVSEFGLIKYRVRVEIEWLKLLFTHKDFGLPKLDASEIQFLDNIITNFDATACKRIKDIESTTNHDVKAVEYYIKEQIATQKKLQQHREFVHFAATSEDINNLSYGLMLKDARLILINQLEILSSKIKELAELYRDVAMISRTHGQPATPTTMGKELYNTYYRLKRQLKTLKEQEILGKFNGAVGNYNVHVVTFPNINWPKLTETLVNNLGLTFNPFTTQIEPHDYIAEIMDNLRRINTILIDLTRDIWGYISLGYFKQKIINYEVGSSTMPHKVNPIDFENSEGNLGLANSIALHLAEKLPISRWQRDLTDSTVLRNIGIACGYSLLAYTSLLQGLDKLEINLEIINQDLDNNWSLLAEPIQTIMRKNGVKDAYEQLKDLTRGKNIGAPEMKEFILQLKLPNADKEILLKLTPHDYIGLANTLF